MEDAVDLRFFLPGGHGRGRVCIFCPEGSGTTQTGPPSTFRCYISYIELEIHKVREERCRFPQTYWLGDLRAPILTLCISTTLLPAPW